MGYITGTMSDANAPSVLYGLIAAELTAEGWTLEDTVVIGSNTHKVWKNSAANNPANVTFFVDVYYPTTGGGAIRLNLFEDYDAATDRNYRQVSYATSLDATYRSYSPGASTLESGGSTRVAINTSTASFGYWILVSNKAIIAIGSVDPTIAGYVGLYEPRPEYAAAAGALLFPVVACRLQAGFSQVTGSSNPFGLTRIPPYGVSNAPYMFSTRVEIPSLSTLYARLPTGNTIFGSTFAASKIEIILELSASPARLGTLYDLMAVPVDSTVARGDTVSIDGDTYVLGSADANISHAIRVNG